MRKISVKDFRGPLGLVLLLVGAVIYAVCLVAVHISVITVFRYYKRLPNIPNLDERLKEAVVSITSGVIWIPIALAISVAATWSFDLLWLGAVLGTIVAASVSWEVRSYQTNYLYARTRGSMVLGNRRIWPFLVRQPWVISPTERLKHVSVQGATGAGKTTALTHFILKDINHGAGVCVIDPKDHLIDNILPHIGPNREDDVILLDATDVDRPIGFNPLSGIPSNRRSLAASETILILKRYFADSWGTRLEHVLTNVILALLETPDSTMLDIYTMLVDPLFRGKVVDQVSDPGVKQFFLTEFDKFHSQRGDTISPILNKIGPWISYPELRNIIGQPRSTFSVRQVMDQGKILLVRIPQGALGDKVSSLLGALIVAKVQLAAQSRVDIHAEQRRPFYLYVDEFQNFATSSFDKVLTEARGFKLGLVCANQYGDQLSRELQMAMTNNVANSVECLYQEGKYRLQVMPIEFIKRKLEPISLTPFAPLPLGNSIRAERIRDLSRARYGRDRSQVESMIIAKINRYASSFQSATYSRLDIDED